MCLKEFQREQKHFNLQSYSYTDLASLSYYYSCISVSACNCRNVNQSISKPCVCSELFLFEERSTFAVSWFYCDKISCQMCSSGIITSFIMTPLCFTLSALLSVSPLEIGHVGSYQRGESLPQRHRLHPFGETAQPTRSESKHEHLGDFHTCSSPL